MAEQPAVILERKVGYWGKRLWGALFMTAHTPIPLEFEELQKGLSAI